MVSHLNKVMVLTFSSVKTFLRKSLALFVFLQTPMKKFKSIVFFGILLIINSMVIGQEVIFPLNVNQALINQPKKKSTLQRLAVFDDTLSLPFEDDFSRPGIYPFDSLWLDSGVYINNNYSERPFTIGIATFDGLNQYGKPYQPGSTQDLIADVLTSRPINLIVPPGDTTVWLSYFYQPQGLGDVPESGDSLILQFKDTGGVWNTVWKVDGRPDTVFQRVNIRITDNIYLFKGFQFRFYNIATVNGNRDHWNLDYLTLKKNTIGNAAIVDNAMVRPQISLLSEFTAMPYSHYKSLGIAAMKTIVEDTIYNIDYGQTSYTPAVEILQNGATIFTGSTFTSTLVSNVYLPFSIPLNNFSFPVQNTDSADFKFKSYFSQAGVQTNPINDTSYLDQHFYNYYSYDDGSAEVGYGLTGNVDVSIAYKFNVKIADTLRGVQIYFNPTGENVTNKLFQLTVWSNIDLGLNQSVELYRMINQKPDTILGLNGFRTYLFDRTLIVGPGNIWVGINQNEPQSLYGVGLDRNTDSRNKMYYHFDGNWYQSGIRGSWMIRPVFGKKIPLVSVEEYENTITKFLIRPNPAHNTFRLEFENSKGRNYRYQIFNSPGALIQEENIKASKDIDISNLSAGVYIVRLMNAEDRSAAVEKLIVQ